MSVLSNDLVKAFVKATKDTTPKKNESFMYGTVHISQIGEMTVTLDGSDVATPCTSSVSVDTGDRVVVMLKDRQAVITSNVSHPTINTEALEAGVVRARDAYKIYIVFDGEDVDVNLATLSSEYDTDSSEYRTTISICEPTEEDADSLMLSGIVIYPDVTCKEHAYIEGTLFVDGGIEVGPLGYRDIHIIPANPSIGGSGAIYAPSFYGSLNPSSDRRLKHDISDTDETDALSKLNAIRHRKFVWNEDNAVETLGYISQELKEIDPGLVTENDDYCYINLLHLNALMSKSIQELSEKVDTLERRVAELESERNKELSNK